MTAARILNDSGGLRAEPTATFSKLGDAQFKRAAGESGDTIDPSMRLD